MGGSEGFSQILLGNNLQTVVVVALLALRNSMNVLDAAVPSQQIGETANVFAVEEAANVFAVEEAANVFAAGELFK